MNIAELADGIRRIEEQAERVLLGQRDLVRHTLIAILAGGHVLVEGVPGLGKTLLVRTLAEIAGASFRRVQFTPDLMPSDVTGGNVFNQKEDKFIFHEGPLFAQLVLADEVNRAPAKTQSALLEAMQDNSVTTDGITRPLPRPFVVIATQNPIESQGTYPLPEAQLDRFLMKLFVRHPTAMVERKILRAHADGFHAARLGEQALEKIVTAEDIIAMQGALAAVRIDDGLIEYVTDIVAKSRTHRSVSLGASPRGSIGLLMSARAMAGAEGRDFVVPDDVKALAPSVLRHRLVLHPDAEIEGVTPDDVVEEILREAKVPRTAA